MNHTLYKILQEKERCSEGSHDGSESAKDLCWRSAGFEGGDWRAGWRWRRSGIGSAGWGCSVSSGCGAIWTSRIAAEVGQEHAETASIACSPKKKKTSIVGKSLPVYDVNNAVGNKNVGYDHFSVIDEDISILDRDLDGLALKSCDHITVREVGAVQRRTRGHD